MSYSQRTAGSVCRLDHFAVAGNNELITALVRHMVQFGPNAGQHGGSAVLVFMPGLKEITDLCGAMKADKLLGDEQRCLVLPLHSTLSTQEQRRVFKVPPAGMCVCLFFLQFLLGLRLILRCD